MHWQQERSEPPLKHHISSLWDKFQRSHLLVGPTVAGARRKRHIFHYDNCLNSDTLCSQSIGLNTYNHASSSNFHPAWWRQATNSPQLHQSHRTDHANGGGEPTHSEHVKPCIKLGQILRKNGT